MSVKLNSSGGGSVTLQEPTTASDFTLTLPAQTANVITDSSGVLNIGSGQIYKDASGNVGIGVTSAQARLHTVQPNTSTIALFQNTNASWAGDVLVAYAPSGVTTSAAGLSARSDGSTWHTSNYGSMLFITGTGGSGSERMRIDSSGKLILSAANQGIQFADGTNQTTAAGLIQAVTTTKTDTFSAATSTFTDITGMSVTITPKSSSNRVLVMVMAYVACSNGESVTIKLQRNGNDICIGDSAGSRPRTTGASAFINNSIFAVPIIFIDSPATTSAVTYKIQGRSQLGTFFLNRSNSDTDNTAHPRTASTITAMEIR